MTLPTDTTTPTFTYTGCENPEYENREEQRVDSNKRSFESESIADKLSKSETSLIEAGHWVFFSNGLVAYWPISKRIFLNGKKYLNFRQPTWCFFLSILYILLNITYIICFPLAESAPATKWDKMDTIVNKLAESVVAVNVIFYRIYCMVRSRKFPSFWKGLVRAVAQITALSSEKETLANFAGLRRWTLKCLIAYAVLGIAECGVVFYSLFVRQAANQNVLLDMLVMYLHVVVCTHSLSALMLFFVIKIITYGFTVCRMKVEQLAAHLKPYKLELGGGTRNIYSAPCQKNDTYVGTYTDPGEISQSSSSTITEILKLVDELENCVESFNHLFGFSLFLVAVLGFLTVMFFMYFLVLVAIQTIPSFIIVSVPITLYSATLVTLCVVSSSLTEECLAMLTSFQRLPGESLSADENYKIQILVSRLSPNPSGIQVAQLFQIRQSFLGAALNGLATYFIVLMQMRQVAVSPEGKESMDKNTGNIGSTEKSFGDFEFN